MNHNNCASRLLVHVASAAHARAAALDLCKSRNAMTFSEGSAGALEALSSRRAVACVRTLDSGCRRFCLQWRMLAPLVKCLCGPVCLCVNGVYTQPLDDARVAFVKEGGDMLSALDKQSHVAVFCRAPRPRAIFVTVPVGEHAGARYDVD